MGINVQILDHSACIAISGRFDFRMHRDFRDAYTPLLDNAAVHEIEIEMSGVDYLDSAALGMLLLRECAANRPVALVSASGMALKVLEAANSAGFLTSGVVLDSMGGFNSEVQLLQMSYGVKRYGT